MSARQTEYLARDAHLLNSRQHSISTQREGIGGGFPSDVCFDGRSLVFLKGWVSGLGGDE